MSLSTEKFQYSTPNEAVADAVMVSYYQLIHQAFKDFADQSKLIALKKIQSTLKLKTTTKCRDASAYALYWLANNPKSSDLFNRYMLVRSYYNDERSGRNLLNHAVFLTRDVNNVWYLGSPANYSSEREDLGILQIASSKKIDDLTVHFSEYPNGDWPTAKYLAKAAQKIGEVKPSISKNNEVTLFSVDCLKEIMPRKVEISLSDINPSHQPNL